VVLGSGHVWASKNRVPKGHPWAGILLNAWNRENRATGLHPFIAFCDLWFVLSINSKSSELF
jgi:hypothetical protein